jgi:hypothetical protein
MMSNMLFWYRQAESLGKRLEQLVVNVDDPEARLDAMKLLRGLFAARENSQRCAVDAAPYIHARLQAIALTETKPKKITVLGGLPGAVEAKPKEPK